MFEHLADFSFKRTNKQAFGFYIAWLGLTLLCAFLVGFIYILVTFGYSGDPYSIGTRIGTIIAIFFSLLTTILILFKKHKLNLFSSYIYIVCSAILAFLGGGILGLIIPSFLSKKDSSLNVYIPEFSDGIPPNKV